MADTRGTDPREDELLDRVDDAIDDALLAHQSLDNDNRCSCGARNNMDGDVLHSHRLGVVSEAVRGVLGELRRIVTSERGENQS